MTSRMRARLESGQWTISTLVRAAGLRGGTRTRRQWRMPLQIKGVPCRQA